MNKMDKLLKLISKCKCGINICINEHRNYYESVVQKLEEYDNMELTDELEDNVRNKMIETDTIIMIHVYPDTPIGFYNILHYDLDLALDKALECFD